MTENLWAVRGVSEEIRQLVKDTAKAERLTIGAWLTKTILAASQPTEAVKPPTPDILQEILTRVISIEAATTAKPRVIADQDIINEMMKLKAEGMSFRAISDKLGVSYGFVQKHIKNTDEDTGKLPL